MSHDVVVFNGDRIAIGQNLVNAVCLIDKACFLGIVQIHVGVLIAIGERAADECHHVHVIDSPIGGNSYIELIGITFLGLIEVHTLYRAQSHAEHAIVHIPVRPYASVQLTGDNAILGQIHRELVIISHQERIFDIADRIIVVADGQVVADGEKEEVLPVLANQRPTVCSVLTEKVKKED